ncbi:Signal transduction histidine kinase [Candidatus Methanophagaceae archaeon]|nr:Signal transduction histidine kinase [Methanophagales archaeon]
MEHTSILIVEDGAEMRETLSDILSDEGYRVKTAGTGKKGLALAKSEKFPICLVDLRLPDITGLEVVKGLKDINADTSPIIITAFASKETAIEALKAGASCYIEKPLNMAELLSAVKRTSDAHQLLEAKRKAEAALRKNEEKYRSLVESTEDSVYLVDQNCRYLFMNERHISRLDFPSDRYVGRPYRAFHSDDDAKRFAEKVKHVFGTGTSVQHEYEDSEGQYFIKTLSPVKNQETGRVMAVTVLSKDITGMKRTDKELIETRDYLNNIIESSADTITVVDMEGTVLDWNKGGEGIMGYCAEEVIGTPNRNFFVDPTEADRIMEQVQKKGVIKNYRTTVVRKDGKTIYVSLSAALLKDKNGIPIGTVRVSRDVTLEVELEKRVKEERDNLNLIFESMVDGVYAVFEDYRVEFMNKVLRDEFGDHVGDICYEVFHGRTEPCPMCKLSEVLAGKTVRWEWHSRKMNRIYDLIETPVKNIDGSISKLTIFRDITKRKKAEEEIQKLNRELELKVVDLEAVTRMKTEFLSITSHELRTPLTPMKAQLQMLEEGYKGRLTGKQIESVELILRNLTRLDNLIKDILDISRIEMGRIKLRFEAMSINDVAKEAMIMQEPFAKEKEINVVTDLAELPSVVGDSERLRQVIGNLMNNAIKFSDSGSEVLIGSKREGDKVLFRITDYGVGISEEDKEKLFKPFSQIDSSMGRKRGGSGLGLAIAKGIIQAHNGDIRVESEPGKGSTFYFTIPLKQKIREEEAPYIG